MIDVMENKILGPAIRKGLEEGLERGKREFLRDLPTDRFGELPAWASQRMASATADELRTWGHRILTSKTLQDTLR